MPTRQACECACECTARATGTDESDTPLCDTCSNYYLDDDGDVICSRVQDATTCRHCGAAIDWGVIQTVQWQANTVEGSCACEGRIWSQVECGGAWRLGETMGDSSDEGY